MSINIDHVLVIKKENKRFSLDRVPIPQELKSSFVNIWMDFENKNLRYHERVNAIGANKIFHPLTRGFDFAEKLGSAYQGIKSISIENMENTKAIKYDSTVSQEHIDQAELKNIEKLKNDFNNRILAYNLSNLYLILDSDDSVLTYSHRKVGWSNPIRRVDENFTFEARTNFGYGSPSYFHTVLTYKGINIVPFCEVILYKYANVAEILLYSSKHSLQNDSWSDVINYLCEASNAYLDDESVFVQEYIVKEIERLLSTLSDILYDKIPGLEIVNNKYNFLNREKEYVDLTKYSHDTMEFKGSKVSESIKFIPILSEMSVYHDFKKEIRIIEDLSKEALARMEYRLPQIDEHLSLLAEKLVIAKKNYEEANIEKDKFLKDVQNSFKEFNNINANKITIFEFERVYAGNNEEFRLAYNKVVNSYKPYSEYTSEHRRFEIIKDNINKYISIIRDYFQINA